jgi:hypothetical protein
VGLWSRGESLAMRSVGRGNARATRGWGESMRFDQGKFETYHLTCMVCGAPPGTTCLDEDYQELPQG